MEKLPQVRSITVNFESEFRVTLASCDFGAIMKAFLLLLPGAPGRLFPEGAGWFCRIRNELAAEVLCLHLLWRSP